MRLPGCDDQQVRQTSKKKKSPKEAKKTAKLFIHNLLKRMQGSRFRVYPNALKTIKNTSARLHGLDAGTSPLRPGSASKPPTSLGDPQTSPSGQWRTEVKRKPLSFFEKKWRTEMMTDYNDYSVWYLIGRNVKLWHFQHVPLRPLGGKVATFVDRGRDRRLTAYVILLKSSSLHRFQHRKDSPFLGGSSTSGHKRPPSLKSQRLPTPNKTGHTKQKGKSSETCFKQFLEQLLHSRHSGQRPSKEGLLSPGVPNKEGQNALPRHDPSKTSAQKHGIHMKQLEQVLTEIQATTAGLTIVPICLVGLLCSNSQSI